MRRRITIEVDAEGTGNLVPEILGLVSAYMDADVEISFAQRIFPEKPGAVLQVPDFLVDRPFRRKGAANGL